MPQSDKSVVPKFDSFKPKPKPNTPPVVPRESIKKDALSENALSSRSRHESRRHKSHDHGFHDGSSRKERAVSQHLTVEHHARNDRRGDAWPSSSEESDIFFVDKRGDQKNVDFGSLHRYDIPKYDSLKGSGRVLGASSNIRIDREASTDTKIVLARTDDNQAHRKKRWLAQKFRPTDTRTLRLVVPVEDQGQINVEDDYIELGSRQKRRRLSNGFDSNGRWDEYRSIENRAKSSPQIEDDDLEIQSESDSIDEDDQHARVARLENSRLSRKTKDNPTDLSNWLALIEYQMQVTHGHAHETTLTKSERRGLADVRIAIVEKALKHFPVGSLDREALLLILMTEGRHLWETSELTLRWNGILKEANSSMALWQRYLNFKQTNTLSFSYEECKDDFLRCLRMLKTKTEAKQSSRIVDIDYAQIHVLVRFTAFVRDAGYEELAFAIWQVVLEYQCSKPDLAGDPQALAESLEAFWESDCPRIGEEGAKRWASWVSNGTRVESRSSGMSHGEARPAAQEVDTVEQFAVSEFNQLGLLHLPAPADDELEDPFCSVMFTDLREIVECIPNKLPRQALINGFLCFIHAPPLCAGANSRQSSFWSDLFLHDSEPMRAQVDGAASMNPIENQRMTTFELFSHAFDNLEKRIAAVDEPQKDTGRFIDRVLNQLSSMDRDDETVAEYYLAFRCRFFPDETAKTAKTMLKSRPSSLRLYNAFALAEAYCGHLTKAEQIGSNALRIGTEVSDEQASQSVLLWHSWVMTTLRASDYDRCVRCLLFIANNTQPSDETLQPNPASRLKAEQFFDQHFERSLHNQGFESAVLFARCAVWLAYLIDGRDLESGTRVVNKYITRVGASSYFASEMLHQARAEMLGFHIQQGGKFKPTGIRQAMAESINAFPDNSLFHDLNMKVGIHTRLDDRLHSALSGSSWRDEARNGLVAQSYDIAQEVARYRQTMSGSTAESVRAAFKRALLESSSNVSGSPHLWKAWLSFEISTSPIAEGEKAIEATSRAKQVFFEGLRHMPWHKVWLVLGMKLFSQRREMEAIELRQVYDTMVEREMRVRINIRS